MKKAKRKIKELGGELRDYRSWLKSSVEREDAISLERSKLLKTVKVLQMRDKHLRELVEFHANGISS